MIPIESIHKAYTKKYLEAIKLLELLKEYQKIDPRWKLDDLNKLRQFFKKTTNIPPRIAMLNAEQLQEKHKISNTCVRKVKQLLEREMI